MTAIDKLEKGSKDGQIRRFTGNDYTKDILKGDSHAPARLVGRRGAAHHRRPEHRVPPPDEGFMIFTDAMQIPVGAPHAFTAEKYIDFVYDPEIQAQIAAYVNYIPPVKGTKEVLLKKDPEVAEQQADLP